MGGAAGTPATVCWNCDEVTNDHYANTCPKPQKKKDDPNRSVTPYPRGRSSSRERGGASQGGETYRMLKGSFVKKPWLALDRQPGPKDSPAKNEESDEEDLVEDEDEETENERKVNQWLIDDAVKDLIEMELNQRKKEGDVEGFEAGSDHWLKLEGGSQNIE